MYDVVSAPSVGTVCAYARLYVCQLSCMGLFVCPFVTVLSPVRNMKRVADSFHISHSFLTGVCLLW